MPTISHSTAPPEPEQIHEAFLGEYRLVVVNRPQLLPETRQDGDRTSYQHNQKSRAFRRRQALGERDISVRFFIQVLCRVFRFGEVRGHGRESVAALLNPIVRPFGLRLVADDECMPIEGDPQDLHYDALIRTSEFGALAGELVADGVLCERDRQLLSPYSTRAQRAIANLMAVRS